MYIFAECCVHVCSPEAGSNYQPRAVLLLRPALLTRSKLAPAFVLPHHSSGNTRASPELFLPLELLLG